MIIQWYSMIMHWNWGCKKYKHIITYTVIVAVEWLSVLTVKAGRLDAWWFCTSPKAREQNVVQHYMDPSVNALNPETLFLLSLPQPNWSELHGLLWEWLHDVSISRILLWFCMDMASGSKSIMPYLGGMKAHLPAILGFTKVPGF